MSARADLFTPQLPPTVHELYGLPTGYFHVEQEPCCYEVLAGHARKWMFKADYETEARQLVISRTSGKRQPDFGSMERHTRNVRDRVEKYGWIVINGHDSPGRVVLCMAEDRDEMMATMPRRRQDD